MMEGEEKRNEPVQEKGMRSMSEAGSRNGERCRNVE